MSVKQEGDEPEVELAINAAAKPKLMRRFFQFRLLVLLMLAVPVAFAAIQVRDWLDDRPIEWKPYSKAELDQHLHENETVLVFMMAEWDPNSKNLEERVFGTQKVRQIIRARGITVMRADYTAQASRQRGDLRDLLSTIDQPVAPNFVIYSPQSRGQPVVLSLNDFTTIEQRLYATLKKHSSWW